MNAKKTPVAEDTPDVEVTENAPDTEETAPVSEETENGPEIDEDEEPGQALDAEPDYVCKKCGHVYSAIEVEDEGINCTDRKCPLGGYTG